jgi:hypothetical protein
MLRIKESFADRLVPLAFAIGLALGFFYCRYWGGIFSQQNPFPNFVRFYQALGPSSNFYATVNQLIALCKSRASKEDVLVVVGGNSTFLGVAQPVEELWSLRLQDNLGRGYVVVNLAQRGGFPTGGAESIAEALFKEGYKVIYVANVLPPDWGEPDGTRIYAYIYWNARARGMLFPWAARDSRFEVDKLDRDRVGNLRVRGQLDRVSNSEDLWNTLCYAKFCTAWDSLTGTDFWKPRKDFKDQEGPPLPVPERFAGDRVRMTEMIRNYVKQPGGTALNPNVWLDLERKIDAGFVPQMRPRSLVVVSSFATYYVHQLAHDEQDRYAGLLHHTSEEYRAAGLHSIESGGLYDEADYKDLVHMVPSGGRRLAGEVTPEVRRIAHELYAQ